MYERIRCLLALLISKLSIVGGYRQTNKPIKRRKVTTKHKPVSDERKKRAPTATYIHFVVSKMSDRQYSSLWIACLDLDSITDKSYYWY